MSIKEKLQELIKGVPDVNDPDVICYWRRVDDKYVYLEGWCDKCLIDTGFPTMERGNHHEKIDYIKDLTALTLNKKAKARENPFEKELKLLEGGFEEMEEAENLYGVSYGIYEEANPGGEK